MQDIRSLHAGRIRKCSRGVFGIHLDPETNAGNWEVVRLLKWRPEDKSYPLYPPLLFDKLVNNDAAHFMNPILVNVCPLLTL